MQQGDIQSSNSSSDSKSEKLVDPKIIRKEEKSTLEMKRKGKSKLISKPKPKSEWVLERIKIPPECYRALTENKIRVLPDYIFWGKREDSRVFEQSFRALEEQETKQGRVLAAVCINLGENFGVIFVSKKKNPVHIENLIAADLLTKLETSPGVCFASRPLDVTPAEEKRLEDEYNGVYFPCKIKSTPKIDEKGETRQSAMPLVETLKKFPRVALKINFPDLNTVKVVTKLDLDKWYEALRKDFQTYGIKKDDDWGKLIIRNFKQQCSKYLDLKEENGNILGDSINLSEFRIGRKRVILSLSKKEMTFAGHLDAVRRFEKCRVMMGSSQSQFFSFPVPTVLPPVPIVASDSHKRGLEENIGERY